MSDNFDVASGSGEVVAKGVGEITAAGDGVGNSSIFCLANLVLLI